MTGELKLDAEEFYEAAQAFIPVTESIRTVTNTSRDDSLDHDGEWGGDEMGDSFSASYVSLRSAILENGGEFRKSFDGFRKAFVDARNEYVERDDTNGELHEIVGREITNKDGQRVTPQADQSMTFDGGETYETPAEIADSLNDIEDAKEEAREDAEETYS